MIRPETGRGWSISGAHRVAAVQRLGPYWAGGWRDGSAGERCDPGGHPQGVPLRSPGIEVTKKKGGLSCPPVPGAGAAVSRREWPRPGWIFRVRSRFCGGLSLRRPVRTWVQVAGSGLSRISHQVAMRIMKNNLFLSIYVDFSKVSPRQTARWALARWSFRPQGAHAPSNVVTTTLSVASTR